MSNIFKSIILFIYIGLLANAHKGPMMDALEHINEMATAADKKYEAESQRIIKSMRRDVARRRRAMKSKSSTGN
jgi:hypothetical protein